MMSMALRQPAPIPGLEKVNMQSKPAARISRDRNGSPVIASVDDVATEQAAIQAVLKGNHGAFQVLVDAHQTRVYTLAMRMLGNEKEAEDAAQDAFTQAYARLRTYKAEWRFKTWVMTIASNLCIDRLRRRKIEPMLFTDFSVRTDGDDSDPVETLFESSEPGPDAVLAKRQQMHALQSMLRELADEDRAMVVMFYWDDMSYDDIARAHNVSVSAVKSRLFRARQKLAQSTFAQQARG
jgi:RNA polymerase sigma-70 factor (ECF subfamily)